MFKSLPKHKTCQRWNSPNHPHYLTFSCFHGRPLLSKDRTRNWLIESITRARELHAFDLWAYVIMPEHAHLLIHPRTHDYSISAILNSVKKPVANKALAYLRDHAPSFLNLLALSHGNRPASHHFWQRGGGYDRNTWSVQEIWEKIDYIHRNPVRRGMVTDPTTWPWSSARDHAHRCVGPLPIDFDTLPPRQ